MLLKKTKLIIKKKTPSLYISPLTLCVCRIYIVFQGELYHGAKRALSSASFAKGIRYDDAVVSLTLVAFLNNYPRSFWQRAQ